MLLAAFAILGTDGAEISYPPSPVIKSLEWAPKQSIIRAAKGSDRLVPTWADDGEQYTSWGDGNGFGQSPRKLSLGFSRITGSAENFVGTDIRSTADAVGDGRRGLKGCAMLSVAGTLYMWAGNANTNGAECRLAWSRDHARTWTWADWTFKEFGYISLVNFGRGYAGARDDFVYAVAHDGPTGYLPADRFILMRVPKDRLGDRSAYQFFARRNTSGEAVWTTDLGARGAIFSEPGACQRQQMTWCAPLKRYLWWQQRPNRSLADKGDTRFKGGFRIFDAPEPWGPWTVVYATDNWDVGPGETASFPAKWMSDDGTVLNLAFSGDDCFSVRKANVIWR